MGCIEENAAHMFTLLVCLTVRIIRYWFLFTHHSYFAYMQPKFCLIRDYFKAPMFDFVPLCPLNLLEPTILRQQWTIPRIGFECSILWKVLCTVRYGTLMSCFGLEVRAKTNVHNVRNEPFSKRTNIRIFVRFDD